jgi:hypothetical protein
MDEKKCLAALGRAIYEAARPSGQTMEERPPVGALVVETTRSLPRPHKPKGDPSGVGVVEKVEEGGRLEDLRVVIRRLDDGTLQPWVNAAFAVAPQGVADALKA